MPRFASLFPAAALVAALGSPAAAQHADFVLFGEPDADAAAVPENQQFVHPITSPYYHENSFVTTDVRAWYLYHDFPNSVLGGDRAGRCGSGPAGANRQVAVRGV